MPGGGAAGGEGAVELDRRGEGCRTVHGGAPLGVHGRTGNVVVMEQAIRYGDAMGETDGSPCRNGTERLSGE